MSKTKRILIVDDDADMRYSVQLALQRANYHVETACDGVDALYKLNYYQPDLIVADYSMPNMTGDQLCQTIKQDLKYRTTPFIFLTANSDMTTRVKSLHMGANDYITKPFSKDELLARVAAHLTHYDAMTETFQTEVREIQKNLLDNVSHELRTPLTLIMGYVSLLLEDMFEAPEVQRQFLRTVYTAGSKLKQIIEDLVFLSHAQSHQLVLDRETVSVENLLTKLLQSYNTGDTSEIKLDLPSDPLPLISADAYKLRLAIRHLIDNAIKFHLEDQKAFVLLAATTTHHELRIKVQDQGIGLSRQMLAHIFEPFYQVDASMTRRYGGTGSGLRIVQIVAEMHGGRIEVLSEEGRGSMFTLVLPLH